VDPVRERLCAVFSEGRQGSGYVVAPRLVLTAGHVIGDVEGIRVALPGLQSEVRCQARSSTLDGIAWLVADEDLVTDVTAFANERWGSLTGLHRGASGVLESEQFTGALKPGSGLLGDELVIDGAHTPPARRTDGRSP
jgi:hypothetical protein